jgi:hypothetical protein
MKESLITEVLLTESGGINVNFDSSQDHSAGMKGTLLNYE